ncbi:glycosyltransferase involved in cell wall biosynthesis [Aurantimicrobium minutum]|uniref:glycosyltransferase family 2 protein n=1 Tax=Aurantimicrobium minutum TaxID=708131 RepID=UPI0024768C83|nr:glycosyltransferase [Aurantimicrobium minutum]MDH6278216.1 glycosyltransferase involved in cell wall biosynthesis [Aurantimicrobium minutum]
MVASNQQVSVSAVIALYNGERHLIDAIESILNQTQQVAEILIVNDGSSDSSVEILNQYLNRNPRARKIVKLLEQDNNGQGSARNAGVKSAQGDLIGFLDQDDTWEPTHVSEMVPFFADNPKLGWVYSDFNEFDDQNRFIRRQFLAKQEYIPPVNSVFGLISQDLMMLPSASLIRREAFLSVGGFDTQFRGYEDDDLFMRIFVAGWAYEYTPNALINYRIHPHNSSRNHSFPKSRIKFYRKYLSFFNPDSDYYPKFIHQHLAPRMISAAIHDATVAARDKDFEGHQIAIDFLNEIFDDTGFNFRKKLVLKIAKRPTILKLALNVRGYKNVFSSRKNVSY